MIALDSSVAVPAVLPWHDAHDAVRGVLWDAVIPAHAAVETYAVLTRLPAPLEPTVAARLVDQLPVIAAGEDLQSALVSECSRLGLIGGSVYDAVIAMTAQRHGLALASRDRRAAKTYELVGASVRWL